MEKGESLEKNVFDLSEIRREAVTWVEDNYGIKLGVADRLLLNKAVGDVIAYMEFKGMEKTKQHFFNCLSAQIREYGLHNP